VRPIFTFWCDIPACRLAWFGLLGCRVRRVFLGRLFVLGG
jgi:hypothetical protein